MQFVFKNRIFAFAALMMIAQQIFVSLSTVAIGRAGAALSDGALTSGIGAAKNEFAGGGGILPLIFWFFTFVAAAYICGAVGQWLSTLLGQNLWRDYVFKTYYRVAKDAGLASENNRRRTHAWLTGEALTTFENTSELFVNFISLVLNIVLTLAAFQYLLGGPITAAVAVAFLLSFLLMYFGRSLIDLLAKKIQSEKITAFLSLDKIWHNLFFGTLKHAGDSLLQSQHAVEAYRKTNLHFKIIEQALACAPIMLTFPIIYWIVAREMTAAAVSIGALVAVLPRTLQLFQNLHMLNVYISQLLQQNSRLESLMGFTETLERRDLANQINKEKLVVRSADGELMNIDQLTARAISAPTGGGRYTVNGSNGAGKSTFLKELKSRMPDAVLLGAEIEIGHSLKQGSTGQKALQQLRDVLATNTQVLLLDEWDANLDEENTRQFDNLLSEVSKTRLVIEARHK